MPDATNKSSEPARGLPQLLRYRDAAFELSMSERHVQDLANQGLLHRVKVGKLARVTTASVRKLAKSKAK